MEWEDSLGTEGLEVKVAELMVATADDADHGIETAVPQVLKLLRDRMGMDVVFVSEFTGGERVMRYVAQSEGTDAIEAGQADPLEASWCQRVVDGRLPEYIADASPLVAAGQAPDPGLEIGTHLSTPIVMSDGSVYGTLCCFSFGVNPKVNEQDLRKLRYTAQLTAQKIEKEKQDQR